MQKDAHPPGLPVPAAASSKYAGTLMGLQLLHSLSEAFWTTDSAPTMSS